MRTLLILGLCATAMVTNAQIVKKDTVTMYVINGEHIRNFNGSQLRGKTIRTYFIDTTDWKNGILIGHAITTTDAKPIPGQGIRITKLDETDLNPNIVAGKLSDSDVAAGMPMFVVDGTEVPSTTSAPSDINTIEIFEPNSPEALKYGERGKNGVMIIKTKSGNSIVNTLYIIDGKKSTEADMKALDPNKIKSIEVLKGKAAEKYTDDPNVGVVIVTTKK